MCKMYIKPKDDSLVKVYINGECIKANDIITLFDENAYYNNQKIDKDDYNNDKIYIIDNKSAFAGFRYLVKYNSFFLASYFIIYTEEEYREQKLNKLLK